jgi:hypothetical protein
LLPDSSLSSASSGSLSLFSSLFWMKAKPTPSRPFCFQLQKSRDPGHRACHPSLFSIGFVSVAKCLPIPTPQLLWHFELTPPPTFVFECEWAGRTFKKARTKNQNYNFRNIGGGFMSVT